MIRQQRRSCGCARLPRQYNIVMGFFAEAGAAHAAHGPAGEATKKGGVQ
jgi:hypothetical protein